MCSPRMAWWPSISMPVSGLSPTFQKLAKARKLEAWNLPLGVGPPHTVQQMPDP